MKIPNIKRPYQDLKNLFDKYLPGFSKSSLDKFETLFQDKQFDLLFANAPAIVFIINMKTVKYEFFSKNVKAILGYDREIYMSQGMEFSMSTMDVEHLAIHNKYIYMEMLKSTQEFIGTSGIKDLRFSTTFKVRKVDGTYIWAMQQGCIFEVDDDMMPLLSIFFMTDIHEIKKDPHPHLLISKKNNDGVYEPLFYGYYPTNNSQSLLTKRELEVLHLFGQGLSSRLVAEKLSLSELTVQTHRKNMLKKTQAKNILELIQRVV